MHRNRQKYKQQTCNGIGKEREYEQQKGSGIVYQKQYKQQTDSGIAIRGRTSSRKAAESAT